jgi:hypothetical protein
MKYRFKPTETFWESFYDLTSHQKESARRAWKIFKQNPFDPRLRIHKIHRLGPLRSHYLHSGDRSRPARYFFVDADLVVTVDVGTHEIYKG